MASNTPEEQRVVAKQIIVILENGTHVELSVDKVDLVDRQTREPLFNYVLEQPQDGETVIEVVQDGNWTGIRPNKRKPNRS